ncbi:MAG: hypothetical protein KKE86_00700, partial [Planctomycetes bacterium]|nr:hypothetical protein [Planctomycetota bacterium]
MTAENSVVGQFDSRISGTTHQNYFLALDVLERPANRVQLTTDGNRLYLMGTRKLERFTQSQPFTGWLGTGPFFGRKTHFAGKRLAENMDL